MFGCILASRSSGYVFRRNDLIQPGFEPELCLRVTEPLSGEVSMTAARQAEDVVFPALEIIETRGDLSAQIAVAIADNAQQKTIVLGNPVRLGAMGPDVVTATVQINGQTVASGGGDAVLGNPLNSVIWSAGKLAEFDRGIMVDDLIMSGSFTRQFPIAPGDRVYADFVGVGDVQTAMLA